VNAEEIRRLADEIVARPEFSQPEPSLIERARQEVLDLVGQILAEAFSGSAGSLLGWAVLILAVVAVIWFTTRLGRTVQVDRRVGVVVAGVHRRTPAEWRAEAEEHEARGEWKEALRARYRALLGDLVAEGVLDDVAGRTTGEYRAQLAADPRRSAPFAAATDLFERAWYAEGTTGPDENARFRALADEVLGAGVGAR